MSVSGCSMWLPMWVFDGNGFTMACLAVLIRNVALRLGVFQKTMRSGVVDATASDGSGQRCRDQRRPYVLLRLRRLALDAQARVARIGRVEPHARRTSHGGL